FSLCASADLSSRIHRSLLFLLVSVLVLVLLIFSVFLTEWLPPRTTIFPYTTLFRSLYYFLRQGYRGHLRHPQECAHQPRRAHQRSEEHTSELQSRENLVCPLLLEKKKCVKN